MNSATKLRIDRSEDSVPAFLVEKSTRITSSMIKKLPETLYATPTGYYTDYPRFFQWQQYNQWCWLAVAASLGNYRVGYNAYNQRALAENLLGGIVNSPGDPARSMDAVRCFGGRRPNRIGIDEVLGELLNNFPLVIGMDLGYRHVAVLSGASNNATPANYLDDYYVMQDPWYGPNKIVKLSCENWIWGSWISTFFYRP